MYMAIEPASGPAEVIQDRIHFVRGQRVMLDSDLAAVYGVTTAALNQAVKRNPRRFVADFAFQVNAEEFSTLISQNVIAKAGRGGRRTLPWVFTEHGAIMLASVLKSDRAVEMSVYVVRAFIRIRELLMSNRELAAKLEELEQRVSEHDRSIAALVAAIRELLNPKEPVTKREIGFHMREQAPPYRISRTK